MKKTLVFFVFAVFMLAVAVAKKKATPPAPEKQYDLALTQDDIFVLPEDETHRVMDGNGAHLFVKKRGDIQSVLLLIDSGNYNDPDLSLMRAKVWNAVNGNEERYANGKKALYKMERTPNALISSTVEQRFGADCFHIYIPREMYYGYVIAQQHECTFKDGMTVSVRAFSEKYGDVGGAYGDNLLVLHVSDWEIELAFSEITSAADGNLFHVVSSSELSQKLINEIDALDRTEKIELVFAIDATESMQDDFVELRKNWLSKFEKQMKKFADAKIGLLFYKDYGDEFKTDGLPVKNIGFVKNASAFSKAVKTVMVKGGGDWEEAVYEALYACANFAWSDDAKKKIILIGDAPPHAAEASDFAHSAREIFAALTEKEISVDCFLISSAPAASGGNMKVIEKAETATELLHAVDAMNAK